MSFPKNTPKTSAAILAARDARKALMDAMREEIPIGAAVRYTTGRGADRKPYGNRGRVIGYRGTALQVSLFRVPGRMEMTVPVQDVFEVDLNPRPDL